MKRWRISLRHAYGGKTDQPVVIQASFQLGELLVTIRDWGTGKRRQASRGMIRLRRAGSGSCA